MSQDHAMSLAPKIQLLHDSLTKLPSDKWAEQLLAIIRKPGWTTPQEARLFHVLLDSANREVERIGTVHRELLAIAVEIERRSTVT